MRYILKHTTVYEYQQPTTIAYNEAWMFPRSLPHQAIIHSSVNLFPEASELSYHEDFFGNLVAYFSVRESHLKFSIQIESLVDRMAPINTRPAHQSHIGWRDFLPQLNTYNGDLIEVKMFSLPSPMVGMNAVLREYAWPSFEKHHSLFAAVNDLNTRIYHDFEYDPKFTDVATPLAIVAEAKKGVCQDFAHVAISCLRSLGFAARYVSGYIETTSPEGSSDLVGSAASHAWFAVYIPEMGWVDFDPTNNQLVKSQHITIGWGRDYQDVPPLKGVIYNSAHHNLEVAVEVIRQG